MKKPMAKYEICIPIFQVLNLPMNIFGTDQSGTYQNEDDYYNREHSFPKNWFNDAYKGHFAQSNVYIASRCEDKIAQWETH
jgi:hypothetical protein